MLPKKNRVDKKTLERVFKDGKFINSPSLTFKYVFINDSRVPRISFVAPKSVAKLAVKRNLLRRRGYSVLGKHINLFPPILAGVFVFKKYQDDALILEDEIKNILSKIN